MALRLEPRVHAVRLLFEQIEVAPLDRRRRAAAAAQLLASSSRSAAPSACRPWRSASTSASRIGVSSDRAMRRSSVRRRPACDLRQRVDVARDAGELIGEAARVALVEQQQVEHQRQHRRQPVARAIGDEAVGELEQRTTGCPVSSSPLLALAEHAEQRFGQVAGARRGAAPCRGTTSRSCASCSRA